MITETAWLEQFLRLAHLRRLEGSEISSKSLLVVIDPRYAQHLATRFLLCKGLGMKTLTRIDGQQRELRESPIVIWEIKSVPMKTWSPSRWNWSLWAGWRAFFSSFTWVHGLPWLVLGALSLLVPGFFLALVGLLVAVLVALLAFVICIQWPLRFLVRCWQQQPEAGRRTAQSDRL